MFPLSFLHVLVHQAEQELASASNKTKLLENDLDVAEDRATDFALKLKDAESALEEMTRENKGLKTQIEQIEGQWEY